MSQYVFIESRDPFASRDVQFVVETTRALQQRGNEVVIFFVQNGVLAVRRRAPESALSHLRQAGVRLLVDDFSLRERGILADEVSANVESSTIDALVELLARPDTKAIWQ